MRCCHPECEKLAVVKMKSVLLCKKHYLIWDWKQKIISEGYEYALPHLDVDIEVIEHLKEELGVSSTDAVSRALAGDRFNDFIRTKTRV